MSAFTTTRILRFGDCDPSGIAYFPAYFHHLVGVVEEFFGSIGVPWPDLFAKQRIGTPTVSLETSFSAPGFHGDQMIWSLRVEAVGRSSLRLAHRVHRGDTELWRATQVIVATSLDTHRSQAWPQSIRRALTQAMEDHRA